MISKSFYIAANGIFHSSWLSSGPLAICMTSVCLLWRALFRSYACFLIGLFIWYSAVCRSFQLFTTEYDVSLEKAMAPHSSTLSWKIPWVEEPGGLQSMGSLRVRHDWATSLSLFTHWRRKWQPTPVFLPGESQGRGSLVGCHLWGRTESDTTEAT